MDGILLTGGRASRLGPITKVTNKHLLPVYDKPMIFYGIELLKELGCERVIIILGGNSVGDIVNLVRDGSDFGVEVIYKFQHEPKGIANAIGLARDIIDTDLYKSKKFLVLLGDNIFGDIRSLKHSVERWDAINWYFDLDIGFAIFLHESERPYDYGQPVFGSDGKITKFVEKQKDVGHNKIVTGLYGLTTIAFDIIQRQTPSDRGEYEITDTLSAWGFINPYEYTGFWSDCGTPEGLSFTSEWMRNRQ